MESKKDVEFPAVKSVKDFFDNNPRQRRIDEIRFTGETVKGVLTEFDAVLKERDELAARLNKLAQETDTSLARHPDIMKGTQLLVFIDRLQSLIWRG